MQALIRKPKPFYAKLHNQVIIAICAAIIMGAAWPTAAVKMKPLGDGFIKLIGMVIAPLVFCISVSGISGMGSARRVARISVKSMVYFYVVSALALLLGLIAANLIPTGTGLNIDPRSIDTSSIAGYVTAAKDQGVVAFLLNIIPVTMIDAFAKGAILQIVLVAALFGLALIHLGDRARAVKDLVDQLTRVVFSIVEMIVKLSPIGAFGAMAFTVGRFGLHSLLPLLKLVLLFYGSCLAFVLIVLVPIARHVGFSILKFCRYILDEILLFLSIANSEALLPRLMEKLERMGVPKSVVGLVVPTGYSFNLAGSQHLFHLVRDLHRSGHQHGAAARSADRDSPDRDADVQRSNRLYRRRLRRARRHPVGHSGHPHARPCPFARYRSVHAARPGPRQLHRQRYCSHCHSRLGKGLGRCGTQTTPRPGPGC